MTETTINLDALDPALLLVAALVAWSILGAITVWERLSSARDTVVDREEVR